MKYLFLILLSLTGPAWSEGDEEMLHELEDQKAEQTALVNRIEEAKNIQLNPIEEIQKLGHKTIDAATLMDDRVVDILQKAMRTTDLHKADPKALREMILTQVEGKPLEKIFKKYPKLLDISVDIFRDKEAIASLIGILKRKDDLKTYGLICIGIMIFGWLIKKKLIDKDWPLFKRLGASFIISLGLSIASLGYFYKTFEAELGPTVRIISKHF